jgi:hypothetical protein
MIICGIERDFVVHDNDNVKGFFDSDKGSYRFLSNFHKAPVYYEGILYPSTENAYQAAKTEDYDTRFRFSIIEPSKSKRLSKELIEPDDWLSRKYDIMFMLCYQKFYRHKDLRELLLQTEGKYLEETNMWNDVWWGVCNGVGENNLGKILMDIRRLIRRNPAYKGFSI